LFIAGFDDKLHRFVSTQSTGTADEASPQPLNTLGESYPNPSSGSTTIPFTLAEPADIELAIFDLLGRKISVVTSGRYPAGRHEVVWSDALLENVPGTLHGGVYFYSLRTGDIITATRMLVRVK